METNRRQENIDSMQRFIGELERLADPDLGYEATHDIHTQCGVLKEYWNTDPFDEIIPDHPSPEARFTPGPWISYLKLLAELYVRAHDPERLTELLACRYSYLTPLERVIVDKHVNAPVRREWK